MNDEMTISNYFKRVDIFLKDKEFDRAKEYVEKILDMDPENAEAYLRMLYIEFEVSDEDELKALRKNIEGSKNYKKVLAFGNEEQKNKIKASTDEISYNKVFHEYSKLVTKILHCDHYSQLINRSLYDSYSILSEELKLFSDINFKKSVLLQEDIQKVLAHIKNREENVTKWAVLDASKEVDKVLPNAKIGEKVTENIENIAKGQNEIVNFIKTHKLIICAVIGILVFIVSCCAGLEPIQAIILAVIAFIICKAPKVKAYNKNVKGENVEKECKQILCNDYDIENTSFTFKELYEKDPLFIKAEEERKKIEKEREQREKKNALIQAESDKKAGKVLSVKDKIEDAKKNLRKFKKNTQKKYYYEQRIKNLKEDLKVAKNDKFLDNLGKLFKN